MPMRGTLPLGREPVAGRTAASRIATSLAQAFLLAISSTELAVVSAFAVAGLFASLCLARADIVDLVATFSP